MATQSERSEAMRRRLLDATYRLLVTRGYGATSTNEVCKLAKVSRGGQLHHFPSRAELVAAAAEDLMHRRLEELRLKLEKRLTWGGVVDEATALDAVWHLYSGDVFYAWLELVVAARTDVALRKVLARVDKRFFERAATLVGTLLLPGRDERTVHATTRYLLAVFDGLALKHILNPRQGEQTRDVLALVQRLGELRREKKESAA